MDLQFPRFSFIDRLTTHNGRVCLVGGVVRDLLLNKPQKDVDLIVSGIPQTELIDLLKKEGRVNLVGKSFGVLKFSPREAQDLEFDIALPRKETSTGAGHRDFQVDFNHELSVEDDLGRRDFTVNAMAYDLAKKELIDPYHGKSDLDQKLLRQVFDNAFVEDPLRLLRAVQFSARFNLKVEPVTHSSMVAHAALIKTVSKERIILEIAKLLTAPRPSVGFDLMRDTGLLTPIFPFITKMIGVIQPMKNNEDVYTHTMKVVDAARASVEMEYAGEINVMFSALFHDAGKPQTVGFDPVKKRTTFYGHQNVSKKIARRWFADYKATTIGLDVDQILNLVENHMFETKSFYTEKAIRRFVSKVGPDNIFKLIDLRIADKKGGRYPDSMKGILNLRDRIRSEMAKKPPFGPRDLTINGHDMMSLGYKPGPLLGEIQKYLVELVLDQPELNSKEVLSAKILEKFPLENS